MAVHTTSDIFAAMMRANSTDAHGLVNALANYLRRTLQATHGADAGSHVYDVVMSSGEASDDVIRYALDNYRASIDDYRTWEFAEDEGGITSITASVTHLTIQRTSGPDCDGSRSDVTYSFVQRPADSEWSDGTHVRPDRRSTDTDVLSDDPRTAWHDYLTAELGHHLASQWLTYQPEPLHY